MSGCCSLECGAKTVAIWQLLGHAVFMLAGIALLYAEVSVELPSVKEADLELIKNNNDSSLLEEMRKKELVVEKAHAAHQLQIFGLIIMLLFYTAVTSVAVLLVLGVFRKNMKYVAVWLVLKAILLALTAASIILRLFALLFDLESDLTGAIIWIVVDILQFWVVYQFWEEKKSDYVPA